MCQVMQRFQRRQVTGKIKSCPQSPQTRTIRNVSFRSRRCIKDLVILMLQLSPSSACRARPAAGVSLRLKVHSGKPSTPLKLEASEHGHYHTHKRWTKRTDVRETMLIFQSNQSGGCRQRHGGRPASHHVRSLRKLDVHLEIGQSPPHLLYSYNSRNV